MTTYTCQKCGKTSAAPPTCGCKAPVTANLTATASGAGSLK